MTYIVELWNVKPAWLELSAEERGAYMAQIGPHIQNLIDQGVKVLTWSENAKSTTERANFSYFAIWSFPTQELANGFEQLVNGAGWYNYFEQVNVKGEADSVEGVIGKLIQL